MQAGDFIESELAEAMNQVREHNDGAISRLRNDAVDKLILRFAETPQSSTLTEYAPLPDQAVTRHTFWQDGSTRSRHKLFANPGQFWPKAAYDKRNKAHEPDSMHRVD